MTPLSRRLCLAAVACLMVGSSKAISAERELVPAAPSQTSVSASAGDLEFFEKKIRPVLATHCHQCHGAEKQKGELRLDSHAGIMAGGELGPEIVSGKPAESRLIEAVRYENPDLQMPPKGKLKEQEIADLTRWVAIGAPWPAGDVSPNSPEKTSSAGGDKKEAFDLAARKARHWCWQPLRPVAVPTVKAGRWVSQPIDQFVLARLEQSGLSPAPPADRRTLIRRASFDLLGLPPTTAEVEAFVQDQSPNAWEAVLDRLLASPHFGERWARHWMDLVRYGESRGHEFDYDIPNAWQYRDYLIRAYNADVPYNQFVTEHMAGDLLPHPRMDEASERNESVLATGFWFLGEWMHSPVDIKQDEMDRVDNQIDVMCKTFLGLTVGCARCHDHKFDAISTRDYYSLAGFLHSSTFREVSFQWQAHNGQLAAKIDALQAATAGKVLDRVTAAQRSVVDRVDEYLLAARDVAADETPDPAAKSAEANGATEAAASRLQEIQTLATARGLDGAVLADWCDEIAKAGKDGLHPLHCWAKVANDPKAETAGRVADLLRGPLAAWQRDRGQAAAPLPGEMIVDYSRLQSGQWINDGLAFGGGPVPAATVRLGSTAEQPIASLADPAAADTFGRGQVLPGVLRTPSFVITAPAVWYRLRGSADVFVCVDSHRMVAGPLHGATKKHVESDGWKWHRQDMSRYLGQRAHLEFRPAKPSHETAISVCLQSEAAPAEPSRVFEPLLRALLGPKSSVAAEDAKDPAHDVADLAARHQRAFAQACSVLVSAEARSKADLEQLRLAEWCVRHPDLFGYSGAVREEVAGVLSEHRRKLAALTAQIRSSPTAMALGEQNGFNEHVLLRGSPKTPGPEAPRRYLEALGGAEQPPIQTGSGRLELARQMVDPFGPLTSRVMVNRVWHHLFGRGIVASVDNFGVLGQEPSHPELLDHLAVGFVEDGWSIKRLMRRLMLSSTYQMSSQPHAAADKADPLNLLLHRANLRRLEGEIIRDALLVASGRFDPKLFGQSVDVHLTPFMDGRGKPKGGPLDGDGRRSVYTKIRRNFLPPMMLAFDMPIPFNTMGRRSVSNVPAQPLILLNDPLVVHLAGLWAERTLKTVEGSPSDRVRAMYLDGFSRPPSDAELAAALAFIDSDGELLEVPREKRVEDLRLWADLAHVLVNAKEFIFIP